jgi:hypothetical protein
LFRHEDRHGFVVFLAHLERYALADLYLFGGHALDPAHHPEALHEIHEHDVVRLAVPVMNGGRRVDGPRPLLISQASEEPLQFGQRSRG